MRRSRRCVREWVWNKVQDRGARTCPLCAGQLFPERAGEVSGFERLWALGEGQVERDAAEFSCGLNGAKGRALGPAFGRSSNSPRLPRRPFPRSGRLACRPPRRRTFIRKFGELTGNAHPMPVDTRGKPEAVTLGQHAEEVLQAHCRARSPYGSNTLPHLDDTFLGAPLLNKRPAALKSRLRSSATEARGRSRSHSTPQSTVAPWRARGGEAGARSLSLRRALG